MTVPLAVLCYHRVLECSDDNWPWFERGTAVTPTTLRAQLAALKRDFDVLEPSDALDVIEGKRSLQRRSVWLTFDDAYLDVSSTALPVLEEFGLVGTVFVTSTTLEHPRQLLPADAWFLALLSASRRQGVVDLGFGPFFYDLQSPRARAHLVDGPARRMFLRVRAEDQEVRLRDLVRALGAAPPRSSGLYMRSDELRALLRAGWTVGSHGHSHSPFSRLSAEEVHREVERSHRVLEAQLGVAPTCLALPDGAAPPSDFVNENRMPLLGLGDRPHAAPSQVVPRFLVRDDRDWVAHRLLTVCGGLT